MHNAQLDFQIDSRGVNGADDVGDGLFLNDAGCGRYDSRRWLRRRVSWRRVRWRLSRERLRGLPPRLRRRFSPRLPPRLRRLPPGFRPGFVGFHPAFRPGFVGFHPGFVGFHRRFFHQGFLVNGVWVNSWWGGYGDSCWDYRTVYDAWGNFLGQQYVNLCQY